MKNSIYWLLRTINNAFPEGNLKNLWRCAILNVWPSLPRELRVNKGDCMVQVGTPRIRTIDRLSKSVGETGRIIVIEPEKGNVETLASFIESNSLKNVTLIPKAAWNQKGLHRFSIAKGNSDHRLVHIRRDYRS
jgi:hypothetical protein